MPQTVERTITVGELRANDITSFGTVVKTEVNPVWHKITFRNIHDVVYVKKMRGTDLLNVAREEKTEEEKEQQVRDFMTRRATDEMVGSRASLNRAMRKLNETHNADYMVRASDLEAIAEAQIRVEIWAKVGIIITNKKCDILEACRILRKSYQEGELRWFDPTANNGGGLHGAFAAMEFKIRREWVLENYGRSEI